MIIQKSTNFMNEIVSDLSNYIQLLQAPVLP